MRLRTAALLASALAAAFLLSLCDHSAIRISSLPQRQPTGIQAFRIDDALPWLTGAYGAVGDNFYWFYRVDPANADRRGGTRGYDGAATPLWTFAAIRGSRAVPLAAFRSRFSGSVTLSQLRPSPSGVLYVAISGYDGSAFSGEVVRLDPSGSARVGPGPGEAEDR